MKYLSGILVLLSILSPAFAQSGPFGFNRGMTRAEVIKLVGEDAVDRKDSHDDLLWLTTAPKPNAAFDSYMLIISPTAGVLKVSAGGRQVDTGDDGTDLQMKFHEIVDGVSQKYGPPARTHDLCTGDDNGCNDSQYWMMMLKEKNRILEAYWEFPSGGPVEAIEVRAVALSLNTGFVMYACELAGFSSYYDQKKAKENQNY